MDRERLMGQAMARGLSEADAAAAVDEYLSTKGGGKATVKVEKSETVAEKPAAKDASVVVEKRTTMEVKPRAPGPKPSGAQAYLDLGTTDIAAPKPTKPGWTPTADEKRMDRAVMRYMPMPERAPSGPTPAQMRAALEARYANDPRKLDLVKGLADAQIGDVYGRLMPTQ